MGTRAILDRDKLPIPTDASIGPGWTAQMIEMANYIGPYGTLRLVDAFGGQRVFVPMKAELNPFLAILETAAADKLTYAYGGTILSVPTAKLALARARRGPIIASVRAGIMTAAEAARVLGTSRSYLRDLVNEPLEAVGAVPQPARAAPRDPRQMDMFPDREI